jgi:predicted deacetylase
LELAGAFGLKPALLVVPDHHDACHLEDHPAFVDELRALAKNGHEIYLHGMTHRAVAEAPSASRFFRQTIVSAGEAEFASIDREEGARRLGAGLARLRALDLPVSGFVAPAWSFRPWLLPLLGAHNVHYTEDHLHVYDPVRGTKRRSLVLNFASRSWGRIASTTLFCRAARPLAAFAPTRIALHPGDFGVALLRREIASLLAWASRFPQRHGHELLA